MFLRSVSVLVIVEMNFPLHHLDRIGAADVFRYDAQLKTIVQVLKHNRSMDNDEQLFGSNLTLGVSKVLVAVGTRQGIRFKPSSSCRN